MEKKSNKENSTIKNNEKSDKYSLEDLLSKCKTDNRHEEIDFGKEGKELI
ncbi:hypothetical protein [Bacillus bombysepticus]